MRSQANEALAPTPAQDLHIWDSHYGPPRHAFSVFREAICSAFMPWTPEFDGPQFEGRVESMALDVGAVGRVSTNGISARKTKHDIASSGEECVYGNYVFSGEIQIEQAGRVNVAKAGDLVLYHSHLPVVLTEKPNCLNANLAFRIPASRVPGGRDIENRFLNTLVPARDLIEPLAACFGMLTRGLSSSSAEEVAALLDACRSLLPVAVGRHAPSGAAPKSERTGLCRDMLRFVDRELSNPELAPQYVAAHLGVSSRYVHKMFANSGTTFSAYVTTERLERIRSELVSTPGRRAPISELAFRWGFGDLSTFNRAFRRRFGAAPRSYRVNP